jgi:uncharacterized membrane protein
MTFDFFKRNRYALILGRGNQLARSNTLTLLSLLLLVLTPSLIMASGAEKRTALPTTFLSCTCRIINHPLERSTGKRDKKVNGACAFSCAVNVDVSRMSRLATSYQLEITLQAGTSGAVKYMH